MADDGRVGVPDGESVEVARRRAEATARAIDEALLDRKRHLFRSRLGRSWRRWEYVWPYAEAWHAYCSLAALASVTAQGDAHDGDAGEGHDAADMNGVAWLAGWLHGLAAYEKSGEAAFEWAEPLGFSPTAYPSAGRVGDRYYDDNAWIGLDLCHQHRLTGEARLVPLAERVLAFVLSGWSEEAAWDHPGGIRWKEDRAHRSRNTCANAPAAELAAELFATTGAKGHLDEAVVVYDWVRDTLRTPEHLYADQIAPDGTVDPTIWSYNQGTMIGAGVLLADATGDARYFDEAEATAQATLERYGGLDELVRQLPAFVAIYFRNLFLLGRRRPDARYRALAEEYGERMWAERRDGRGLFTGDRSLLNASAPTVEVYALLAGAEPSP